MSDDKSDMPPDLPTLADVAERAKVSTATVSRCLNSPDRVVEATRERVLKAVRDLGYSPNFGARALAARRTGTVGAIIPTMENAIFARAMQAFQEELRDNGLTLLVASSAYSPEVEDEQIRALVARGADALLLIGHDRSEALYQFLERRGVPVLAAWVHDTDNPRPSIGFDNRKAMRQLAEKVIAAGHRHLAMISADQHGNDRARERVAGLRAAMAAHGLEAETLPLIETRYSIEHGRQAFAKLMRRAPRPTAVVCGNDVLAVGALRMARDMGLHVPGDVSITGFDDIEIATLVEPPLTTVHVPHRAMGRQAAQLLIEMLRSGAPLAESVELQTDLRLRGTLGPPPV